MLELNRSMCSSDLLHQIGAVVRFNECTPRAKRTGVSKVRGDFGKKQGRRSDLPLLADLIDHGLEDIFEDVPDFHRQVKAACLTIAPTQILRETTLAPDAFKNEKGFEIRRTQDRATVAWNLATGLYYKTQPKRARASRAHDKTD
jgi:hypothetical protein